MPVCVLCESETFDSIDGLYFCQSCGTQSQVNVYVAHYDLLVKEGAISSFRDSCLALISVS